MVENIVISENLVMFMMIKDNNTLILARFRKIVRYYMIKVIIC
ncbi:hypothetical protein PPBDW_II1265 [Photobacterium kishitanii]|nr:hypothetical protein PPBDW_II1265 [Photobacterium kishitanii]